MDRLERFAAFIEQRRQQPHAWGTHDCVLFAADWVLILTGVDHAAEFRGTYHDEASAMRLLANLGGLEMLCTRILGAPITVAQARRGDVLLARKERRHDPGPTLALMYGAGGVAPGSDGLVFNPLRDQHGEAIYLKAWRCGE